MSKRRLTEQQQRRIRRQQQQRLDVPGSGDSSDGQAGLGPEQPGLVISNFGGQAEVEAQHPDRPRCSCHLRANVDALVAGDEVLFRAGEPFGVVTARRPRRSELHRPDRQGRLRTVAANVDQLLLVIAPEPEPHANLIDRYLVAAESTGIPVRLLLNKSDLFGESPPPPLTALLDTYRQLDYPVLQASTRSRDGLDALRAALVGHVTVLVGQSGVGKSSLIQALLPDEDIRIGDLSAHQRGKGRHTTTAARVYHLRDGGSLIDSPGIREFALVHLDGAVIAQGFRELRPYLGRCRFRDCRHVDEPGCAVLEALAASEIHPARHASYCRILLDNDSDG